MIAYDSRSPAQKSTWPVYAKALSEVVGNSIGWYEQNFRVILKEDK